MALSLLLFVLGKCGRAVNAPVLTLFLVEWNKLFLVEWNKILPVI